MLKILITGARGQLGQDLSRALASEAPVALDRDHLDVADLAAVARTVADLRPDVVLNTAAYNHVDRAEDEPAEAFRVNALGPYALARACEAPGAMLVHFSTDYVFGSGAPTPRLEHDPPSPRGAYAVSKLAGEQLVRAAASRHMVIRTSGLYGLHGRGGKGGNFVETMLRLAAERKKIRVVSDQVLAPTFSEDLARKVAELLERWGRDRAESLLGLYHLTSLGSCSWFDFAAEIFRRRRIEADLEPVSTAEYGAKAPRPAYSVLAPGHLERLGLEYIRHWRDALGDYLSRRSGT
ncbi:MAG: dTDP-4-dehydrorhamnose reductase [Candidatus Binatia bacterium]